MCHLVTLARISPPVSNFIMGQRDNIIWALKQMKHGKLKLLFGRLKILFVKLIELFGTSNSFEIIMI